MISVRRLQRSDRAALEAALAKLSQASRRARFLGPKSSFSQEDLDFLLGCGGGDHLAFGAFRGGELVAEGRLVRSGPDCGEVALGVIDAMHRRGIGALLMQRLRHAGRDLGIRRITGHVLADNAPMLGLLRKLGARIGLPSLGVYAVEI